MSGIRRYNAKMVTFLHRSLPKLERGADRLPLCSSCERQGYSGEASGMRRGPRVRRALLPRRAASRAPVAVTVFPSEQYQAPRSWTERAYPKLIYYNRVDKGGHFAAWEQPMLFTQELRAAFKSVR
jgi:hypothetical protein